MRRRWQIRAHIASAPQKKALAEIAQPTQSATEELLGPVKSHYCFEPAPAQTAVRLALMCA